MKRQFAVFSALVLAFLWTAIPAPAVADSSHARIVRLSLVQGDVRFAREFHKDSLTDSKASWEVAPLNLPIRQGFALATDANGRAEVEFENGAMAFLSANTLIEFYDLSLNEGALVTRLVLRQGGAIFYVHPANGDYFSVTGGDFSVEASGRSRFRLDNYDDGSTLSVEQGRVNVLRNNASRTLEKGQTYSINVNDAGTPIIGGAPEADDFDKWVSGRIDSVATATAYSEQYVSSPGYSSGFADLFTYGSWFNIGGYGYGWQPFGMGPGWCPFNYGSWYYDPFFGWTFLGSAPWGWLPYHYGGWVFSPRYGWVWIPYGFGYGYGYPIRYRPVTGVWVHSGRTTGLVPVHPADTHGKPPLNLGHGFYPLHGNTIAPALTPNAGQKWSVVKHPSGELLASATRVPAAPPTHISRTILSGNSGSRAVTLSRDSSITYDPKGRRFVNTNEPGKATSEATGTTASNSASEKKEPANTVVSGSPRTPAAPAVPPHSVTPPRPSIAPPKPHTSSGRTAMGGGHSSGGSHGSASVGSAHASSGGSTHSSGGHH